MNDVLTGTDRILNTPLPIAYSIAISQITWVYILILPFQLYKSLEWITIPASVFAAYIILGIALIGMCAFLSVARSVVVRWDILPC